MKTGRTPKRFAAPRPLRFQDLADSAAGIYVDLNGDGADEVVILSIHTGLVYENDAGVWRLVGHVFPRSGGISKADFGRRVTGELAKGNVSATAPKWRELSIGDLRYSVNAQ